MTGSLSIVLKECFLRAGFLWNSDPLLSDAIKRWGEKQWRVHREMAVKRQTEGREDEKQGEWPRAAYGKEEMESLEKQRVR